MLIPIILSNLFLTCHKQNHIVNLPIYVCTSLLHVQWESSSYNLYCIIFYEWAIALWWHLPLFYWDFFSLLCPIMNCLIKIDSCFLQRLQMNLNEPKMYELYFLWLHTFFCSKLIMNELSSQWNSHMCEQKPLFCSRHLLNHL